ncbi:MAG: HD domain-containing protein [Candidatus Micrarchaeota archaeon]
MIIKDEIYGTISFSETEKRLIDTAEFQRLHRIKQMALTYLVYPGATHTRFAHALGTMHLTSQIADKLQIGNEEKQELRLYALLHDIGHLAFSHDSEKILKTYLGDHEKIGEQKVCKEEIADILNENHSAKEIWRIGESKKGEIVTSDLGADRMDYLTRDAHNTGVAYGIIDTDRLTHTLCIENGELCIEERGLEAAETLLIARFMMFSTVYLHKTTRIAAAMFRKAVEMAIENKDINAEEFLGLGDDEALMLLRKTSGKEFVERILNRKLYKAIKELDSLPKQKFGNGMIIDLPYPEKGIDFKVKAGDKLVPITELSELIKALKLSGAKRNKILVLEARD